MGRELAACYLSFLANHQLVPEGVTRLLLENQLLMAGTESNRLDLPYVSHHWLIRFLLRRRKRSSNPLHHYFLSTEFY